ncbi:MAG: DUF167 domain-containing protein [Nitrososphaera sp.]|nr:DUF167 domain-containing protein [Nitrososphaera sp.]
MRYSVSVKSNSKGRIEVNGDSIIISIKSRPERGRANRELVKRLSHYFNVEERRVRIVAGIASRKKVVDIV